MKGEHVGQEAVATGVETELQDFDRRLEEFKNGLPKSGQKQLAAMVAIATDETDAAAKPVDGERPSDKDVEGFLAKLVEFHDSLPGNEHELLDAIVRRATGDEGDVQGYRFIWWGWMPNKRRADWIDDCEADGGGLYYLKDSWGRYIRKRGTQRTFAVGCWVDD
jgi:hypothetical protein